ncbi:hypothetical protein SORBI_3010G067200, partial [Sorghum bicolor]
MSRSFLTLIAIAVAVVSSVDSHATDRTALLAFKSGVRGNLSGWGSPKMCNWTGVTCDSTERVAHLLLNNCNLSGVISPAIGNLSALKTLDLRFNQLSGIIPPELGMLSHLLVLRLSYNSLTGSIPEAVVCNCTSLTSIALSFNSLTGKIPFSARCRLPRLQHLSLHENRLQGNIPLSMSNFTSLSSVFLHYNSLGGVLPSQMFNKMPSLQYLYLSFNNFSSDGGNTNLEPFLASLVNCTRLQELGLESNGLGGEIPAMIGNLSSTNLSELYLDDNKITGAIPRAIGNLSALKTLDLRFNQLSGIIPPELGMLSQLLVLGLGHNSLTGSIPEAVICNCTSLTSIALSSNSLTGEIPFSAGCQLQRLQHLGLYENKLEGGIPLSMSNFTSLSWVLLQSNHLGGVLPSQMFNKMTSLQYLHLSGNNFSSDSGNTDLEPFLASLVNCTGLQELGLKSNGLGGEIPAIIGNLSSANLSELYLDSNEITGAIPRTIGNLASLTYLQLQNNMLEGPIPSEVFHPRGLTGIVLSNNQINGEIPKSISLAQKLSIIRISNSGLRGAIPETLSNLTLLDYLVLDHNQLSGAIPPGLSCRLILDLSYNKLTGQIPIGLARLSSFQMYLNLSNNLLEGPLTLEFGNMEMIQALDLSGNKLSGGLPSSIGTLKNLHFLDVSFNSLTGTIPQSLQGLPLQFANFSHNNFTGEVCSGGSFANLTDDSFLGNPGLCGSIPGMAPCISRKHGRFLYIAIGVVVVVAVAVGLLAMVCVVLDHYLMKGRLRLTAAPSSQLSRFPTGLVNATGEKESGEHHPRISYWELADATDGFSEANLIGKGGYGHVYRGVLHDETAIAVKVLRQDHAAGEVVAGSFERECRVLRSIRHRNLIRVITACSTPEFKAVVLPFMPNGSLETLIHGPPSSGAGGGGKPARLDLDLLLSVASNVAEGMAYLHHHAPVRVVHCDLKPSNVLLDADMTAVVSDFGISKLVVTDGGARDPETMGEASTSSSVCNSITRLLQGSVGYIAPEYGLGGRPSTQGDVYSFGVMLLEMISGKRPTDVISEEGHGLHDWAKKLLQHQQHDVVGTVDVESSLLPFGSPPRGEMEVVVVVVVLELLELGVACSQLAPSMRPTMDDVAHEIACLRD